METDKPLISIIVPVYNTEEYLKTCLESLRLQTYKNLEFIIVNDGSTDKSLDICKKYVSIDNRFKLINQENKGRAAARNTGISKVSGEYIGFVDSDDWIEKDMFEHLYDTCIKTKSDIVQCSYFYHKNGEILDMPSVPDSICTRDEALELLFQDKLVKNFLFNKLFKAELFEEITFPVGKNFEDVAVLYKVFAKANKIAFSSKPMYHYIISTGSVSHSKFKIKDKLDYLEAINEQYHWAESQGLWEKSSVLLTRKYLSILKDCYKNDVDKEHIKYILKMLKQNINTKKLWKYAPYLAIRRTIRLLISK